MLHKLTKIALAPVLLLQGRQVKRDTPRLAEAEGVREGIMAPEPGHSAPGLRVLIVGDSAAAGVGGRTQDGAWMGQLIAELSGDFSLGWKLIARSGWTTGALMRALQKEDDAPCDVVVSSLGVIDVLGAKDPKIWRARQADLIALLEEKFGPSQIILTGVPPMHLFPSLPQPLRWFLGQSARRLNRELAHLGEGLGYEVVTVDFPLDAEVMAADGFHPGAVGYRIWAAQVAERIRSFGHGSAVQESVG